MKINFSVILELFEFVNFGSPYEFEGYICKKSGKTFLYSEFGDHDEELPDDISSEKYWVIPYKSDLNLGSNLVFEFVQEHLPTEYEKTRMIFNRKGAYARFKSLLESADKIEEWYKFEAVHTEEALRDWCLEQGIEVSS